MKLDDRAKALLRKVGRYYLQYEGVVDLEGLLLGPRGTRPLPADEATLAYLRYYALHLAVGAAVEAAEAALRDRLVSRELSVEYSEEPVGVARSVAYHYATRIIFSWSSLSTRSFTFLKSSTSLVRKYFIL